MDITISAQPIDRRNAKMWRLRRAIAKAQLESSENYEYVGGIDTEETLYWREWYNMSRVLVSFYEVELGL